MHCSLRGCVSMSVHAYAHIMANLYTSVLCSTAALMCKVCSAAPQRNRPHSTAQQRTQSVLISRAYAYDIDFDLPTFTNRIL